MSQAAACGESAGYVDGFAILGDVDDFPFQIDHERGAVGDALLFIEDAVLFGHLAQMIGSQGERSPEFFRPMVQRRNEVRTDGDHLCVRVVKIADTRLVGCEFGGSTTGERGGEKCEDHIFLTAIIRERHLGVVGGGQSEVGGFVADFERGVRLRLLHGLRKDGAGGQRKDGDLHEMFHEVSFQPLRLAQLIK